VAGGEDEEMVVGMVVVVAAREASGVGSGDVVAACGVADIRDGDDVGREDSKLSKFGIGDDDEVAEEEEEKVEVLST
jgi:hypothetical protein